MVYIIQLYFFIDWSYTGAAVTIVSSWTRQENADAAWEFQK